MVVPIVVVGLVVVEVFGVWQGKFLGAGMEIERVGMVSLFFL